MKSKDRRAKTECHNREEWGHHAPQPQRDAWTEDRAKTSQLAGRRRVEEQAPGEQGAEEGDRHHHEGRRVDKKRRSAQRVQWACQTRLQQRRSTEDTRLRAKQGCPAWTWTTRRSDRPFETIRGQKGEWETIPSGGHFKGSKSGGPQMWAQQEGEDGRGTWPCRQGHRES